MADPTQTRVGIIPQLPDGGVGNPVRLARQGELVTQNQHGMYQEAVVRGQVFSLSLITSTGVAAGQIVAASAAASTQFAVFNPVGSGKNLSLLRLRMGVISGTAGAGAVMHSVFAGVPTLAASGTPVNNLVGAAASSIAKTYASAAGATLTGGVAPTSLMVSTISYTNTAQATVTPAVIEDWIDGTIVIPPGFGYAPLQPAAGTSFLVTYGLTWEEVPL